MVLGLGSLTGKNKEEDSPVEDVPKHVPSAADESHINGHAGHLTPEREQALAQFKTLCTEKGFFTPADPEKKLKASHDDATMLRFLRARKFEVEPAFQQFKDTEIWRDKNQLKWLYDTIEVEEYEEARRVYPQWIGRRDKRGIPVYVYQIAHLNSKVMKNYDSNTSSPASKSGSNTPRGSVDNIAVQPNEPPPSTYDGTSAPTTSKKLLRLFALYENMLRFIFPLCTALPRPNMETPISCTNNIVDISGVGLMQFWNLKGHMQDASTLATAHYPETLDRIFVIGAPSFFPTVWGWIKKWFDPGTTSKIFILSAGDVTSVLTSFIDPANIPVKYGGQLQWEWGQHPVLDDEAKNLIGMNESNWVEGPLGFKDYDAMGDHHKLGDGTMEVEILGSTHGSRRRAVVRRFTVTEDQRIALPETVQAPGQGQQNVANGVSGQEPQGQPIAAEPQMQAPQAQAPQEQRA